VALLVQTAVMRQNEARVDFDEDAIRKIAYDLWERRGAPIGSPDMDWIEAQRQLLEGHLDLRTDGHTDGKPDFGVGNGVTRGVQP
jgi:hypothetical protein